MNGLPLMPARWLSNREIHPPVGSGSDLRTRNCNGVCCMTLILLYVLLMLWLPIMVTACLGGTPHDSNELIKVFHMAFLGLFFTVGVPFGIICWLVWLWR